MVPEHTRNVAPAADRGQHGVSVQRLSTEGLRPAEQYAFWKETVCDLFVGLDCRREGRGPFLGTAVRRMVDFGAGDSVSFIEVMSEPQRAARLPGHIRHDSKEWLMLVVQAAGPAVLRQDGLDAVLGPGDMVLFDSTRPYEFLFTGPFRQMVVKVPHRSLSTRLPRAGPWLARPVRASSPLGSVLAAHVSAVSEVLDHVDAPLRAGLIERTIDLVAFTFAGALASSASASTARRALAARALQYLDAHIATPGLTPAQVAAALGISVGYLHRLLQGMGTSMREHLRARRLARCREELASPLHRGEQITEIALRWGFGDLAQFSRAFRAAYGQSPRDFRASLK